MRRSVAILLLLVFCSLAGAPLLASTADSDSSLPACCRRNGKHHCMMRMMMRQMPGTAVSAPPEKCPLFPKSPPAVTHDHWLAPPPGAWLFADAGSDSSPVACNEIQRRTLYGNAHSERGPPASSSITLS